MARKRHTLLVVDDEPDVVKSVKDLLRLDYKVLGATRAVEALQLLEENEVQIVMSDQRMPEMTGVEFLSRLRNGHADAIRLLFTGYADIKAVIDAINQGNVYRYITKPWDPDELQAIIRQAAQHYDLIVEKKRLMTELQTKNQELEQVNQELKEHDRIKSVFIQVASHELRTPLTILLGLSELAAQTPGLQEQLADWLQRIHKAGTRLNRHINQMLKLLHGNEFDRSIVREPTDLCELITDAVEDVKPFIGLRSLNLETNIAPPSGPLNLDRGKVRDIIDHLLFNAIKFTPDDGTITVSSEPWGEGGIALKISDTGVGIDPQNLPRIFDPFFTGFDVHKHTSGQYEFGCRGMGLGLSIVKLFTELHGGTVDMESRPGEGTSCVVRLPAGG